ncbi:hypothetical protein BBP40_009401 [Aspergillus hancockii]|nr:hypothetical protein BBP40_009401 [Aspergillus hancockii]
MSRTSAPETCYQDVTAQPLADQVIGLLNELNICTATFYGCSSVGVTVRALVANPLETRPKFEVIEVCRVLFSQGLCEDKAAFDALGGENHSRLRENCVTWVRNYIRSVSPNLEFTDEELRRPIIWTLGALNLTGAFLIM